MKFFMSSLYSYVGLKWLLFDSALLGNALHRHLMIFSLLMPIIILSQFALWNCQSF